MGNKSKTQGKKQDRKWAQRRDMSKARQPKSWTQWAGMQPRTVSPLVSAVITPGLKVADLSPQTRVNRQFHYRMPMKRVA